MTENIIISSLDRLCRTCLAERHIEELRPLFGNAIDTQIMDITSIKVNFNPYFKIVKVLSANFRLN